MTFSSSSNLTELSELTPSPEGLGAGLYRYLTDRGFTVSAQDERLIVSPGRLLTDEDAQMIRQHKAALIAYLLRDDESSQSEVTEFSELTPRLDGATTAWQGFVDGPRYTCPSCHAHVPCDLTHHCDGLLGLPDDAPFGDDFANLIDWHLQRIKQESAASTALYQNLIARKFTLIVTPDLELVIGPDKWLDDDDRAEIARYRGWLIEHVQSAEIAARRNLETHKAEMHQATAQLTKRG